MAANLDLLDPRFKTKVQRLLARCKSRGWEMRAYMSLRDPFVQAKLWRQSRATAEIRAKIAEFEAGGAPFLAHCLDSVGPQHGDPVTNAPPGLSWHQWGEAVDCFWLVDGAAEWSTRRLINGRNGYAVYAEEAKAIGLDAGGLWTSFKDWPHVQLRPAGSPLRLMALREVDAAMRDRFGQ